MVAQDMTFVAGGTPDRAPASPPAWREHLAYWTRQLRGATGPELPTDRSRPAGGRSTATHRFALPAASGASSLEFAVAAVQVVLARYTGTPDVTVATVVDRAVDGAVETAGAADVVVLRSDVDGSLSFVDFLRAVHATVADARAHAVVPFEDV